MPARGLYLVTAETEDTDGLCHQVDAALRGGAVLVQYRNKHAAASFRRKQAQALQEVCADHRVAFLINDDMQLALQLKADGVHVGRRDASVAQARAVLGAAAIVGASCYDSLDQARRAREEGATYIAFGAFHASATKPDARQAHPDVLQQAATLGLPRVAIGGIRADNARDLIAAGADLVAVVSDIFDAADAELAARSYLPLFQD
jgi:thiamine-phosphate pyrophosphorylase